MVYPPYAKAPSTDSTAPSSNSPGETILDSVNRNAIDELLEILQNLREHSEFVQFLNYADMKTGQCALHLAASQLNVEIIYALLTNGANPNAQDGNGNTPVLALLFRLKDFCQCEDCKRKTVKCINLLGAHGADMNICDKTCENTPLYLSAINGFDSCATALLNNGAVVGMHGARSMMAIFLEKIPDVVLTVFDRAIKMSSDLPHEKTFQLTFDMSAIIPPIDQCSTVSTKKVKKNVKFAKTGSSPAPKKISPRREMGFLSELLNTSLNRDVEIHRAILQHPMVHVFADIKWNRLKFLYFAYMMMQINFLVWYTIFLILAIYVDCQLQKVIETFPETPNNSSTITLKIENHIPRIQIDPSCQIHILTKVVAIYVLCSAVCTAAKEMMHCFLDFKNYIRDMLNYIQIIGIGTTLLTLLIVLDPTRTFYLWLYPLASFGIGICWCQLFLLIGRMPNCAIYLEMLSKIVLNFCVSLSMYSFILIAFATSYCMLFPDDSKFSDLPMALIRVISMMVGELNYETIFGSNTLKSPIFAQLWYVALVILVSMVLMNLLVGLAVSDISGCKKFAELVVIQRRIRYLTYLEKSFYLGTLPSPKFIRDFLRKRVAIVVPSDAQFTLNWLDHTKRLDDLNVTIHPNDPKDKIVLTSNTRSAIKKWIKKMHVLKSHVGQQQCASAKKNNESKYSLLSVSRPTSGKENGGSLPKILCEELRSGSQDPQNDSGGITNNYAFRQMRQVEYKMQRLEAKFNELDTKLDRYFEKFLLLKHKTYEQ